MTTRTDASGRTEIRLPVARSQHEALHALAERSGVSASQHVRLALLQHLDDDHWTDTANRAGTGVLRPSRKHSVTAWVTRSQRERVGTLSATTGLPVSLHLRLALARYLAQAAESASN